MSSGQESDLLLLLGSVPGAWGEVEGLDQLWGCSRESQATLPHHTVLQALCRVLSHQYPICPCPGIHHLDFRLTWSPALQVEIPM